MSIPESKLAYDLINKRPEGFIFGETRLNEYKKYTEILRNGQVKRDSPKKGSFAEERLS